ncbi:ATP-dependent DNA helicase PIF1 [Trifolium repens]|nr:ATP-dependent DNA helicase PIF1 [Trifolium repens]
MPSKEDDPAAFNAVKQFMLHGPCGVANTNAPCMPDGVCNKNFPKMFCAETIIDRDGFPVYRRRDDGRHMKKGDGPDRATVLIEENASANTTTNPTQITTVDEIKTFLDCRYVSACEASWRIFKFDIHYRSTSVMRLGFHLQEQNSITLRDSEHLTVIQSYCLIEMEKILIRNGKELSEIDGMPLPDDASLAAKDNRLITEELNYNVDELRQEHERCHQFLNEQQLEIYNHVLNAVNADTGGFYFVYGHGGTGKTFLYRTIIEKLRSERKIVLAVASSGEQHMSACEFNEWLIQIGDGKVEAKCRDQEEVASWTRIPTQFLIEPTDDPLKQIVQSTYPELSNNFRNEEYLRERAILTPLNETVDDINDYIVQLTEGPIKEYNAMLLFVCYLLDAIISHINLIK